MSVPFPASTAGGIEGSAAAAGPITPADNTQTSDTERPDIPHPAYNRMAPFWNKCRALMRGTEEIREGGEAYLLRRPNEPDDVYNYRKQLTALFNGFKRTVKACVGLIHATETAPSDDMPAQLTALWENIDRKGTHGAVFAKRLTEEGMIDGLAGIFVDYYGATGDAVPDRDQQARAGYRPYFVAYRADDVIKPIYEIVNGVSTLTLLVLRETCDERVGSFGIQTVTYYRVYRLAGQTVTFEEWKSTPTNKVPTVSKSERTMRGLTRIPWAPFITGEIIDQNEVRPPLDDLADLNLEHHQVKTNIRYLEGEAMVPTPVRVGARSDGKGVYPPLTTGPRSVIEVPKMEGVTTPVYYLTPDVTVLDPGNKSLDKIAAEMGAAGLAFLAPDIRQAETATAKRIDSTAQNASLSNTARALQDCLELAFEYAAEYLSITSGSVTVNRDFEQLVMDPVMVQALGSLAANGKLSLETLLTLLEKGRILEQGFNIEDEVRRIMTENKANDPTPTDNTGNNNPPTNNPPQ